MSRRPYITCTLVFSVHGEILDSAVLRLLCITAPSEHLRRVCQSLLPHRCWDYLGLPSSRLGSASLLLKPAPFCWRLHEALLLLSLLLRETFKRFEKARATAVICQELH